MSDGLVLIETRDRIATMPQSHPLLNPMSHRMFDAIHAALAAIEQDGAAEGALACTERREPRFSDL